MSDTEEVERELEACVRHGIAIMQEAYDKPINGQTSVDAVSDLALALAVSLAGADVSMQIITACSLACRAAYLVGVERGQVKGVG